ncbi:equilibrative nucleotide transporter 3-like [Papaver somniferum]|uniref:equilibrative nucleotide transporter 3-like n=1 Tax=Papaver somniferum TaxID=3469 RepID=UPI000E6F4E51|nr:equilibrative nucleotide transporter 3-like [Papaver somniferum]
MGAIIFLVISVLFELLCLLLNAFVFAKIPVVKYYHAKAALEGSKTVMADLAYAGVQVQQNETAEEGPNDKLERLSDKQLILENKDYAIIAFLISLLTYSIFPGFLAEDTGKHGLGTWYALVLLAMFNVWDLLGRYIPIVESLKLELRKGLMIAIVSRFALVPAFYFTAKYGEQSCTIFLTSLLGLTNGYLSVCFFTIAPQGYKGPKQNALGNLHAICVLGGLVMGITLDWMWLIAALLVLAAQLGLAAMLATALLGLLQLLNIAAAKTYQNQTEEPSVTRKKGITTEPTTLESKLEDSLKNLP